MCVVGEGGDFLTGSLPLPCKATEFERASIYSNKDKTLKEDGSGKKDDTIIKHKITSS